MTVFSLFCIGSEKFSPSCIKHWTSCGVIIDVKLTSQFCFLEIKEDLGMLLMNNAGSILIMTPSFEFVECEGKTGGFLILVMLVNFSLFLV